MESVRDFIFGGPKIPVDGDSSHEIKTLVPWKKSYDKHRQCIIIQRHYFSVKDCIVKTMIFLVILCGCESWTIKKAECQRIDDFELWH